MLKKIFTNKVQNTKIELEQFQTRLKARIFLLFIYITQVGQRTYFITNEKGQTQASIDGYHTSFPFLGVLIAIVLGEAFLYKKIGVRILKYSNFISAFFFLVATAEWLVTLYAGLLKSIQIGTVHGYNVPAIFGFTSFSWRIMMQAFIVQTWYLRSIAPTAAYLMTIGYSLHLTPKWTAMILVRGLLQIVYVICIWYFEQKINLKLLLSNLHQEKWLEMNQFILNNVPEKIAILDWDGQVKFMSDYLKTFIDKFDFTSGSGFTTLCKEIKDLEQNYNSNASLHNSSDRSQLERSSATVGDDVKVPQNIEKFDSLEELLSTFRTLFKNKSPSGDSFLVFNGKLKVENSEKSIEVKVSLSRGQYSKQFLILLIRDTTQRDQVIRLEASNKYKDQLLASVSHELRTPLNGSINLLEASLCSNTIDTQTKQDLLMPALNSSKFLLHLINDILDMSQIKAEKLRLTFQRIDPRETITNAVKLLTLNAQMKGINLELELQDDLPHIFSTDHVRLSQIILNLLHNSIKFTQVGSVKISAEPVEGMPWIKIIIQDSGIGMTKEEIKQLFSVFTHIESQNRENLNPTGAGLGLSIAHNLAKILGPKAAGGIKVSSTPNQGSTFTFFIENREAHSKRTMHVQARANQLKQEESLSIESHLEIGEEPMKYKTIPSYVCPKSTKFLTMSLNPLPAVFSKISSKFQQESNFYFLFDIFLGPQIWIFFLLENEGAAFLGNTHLRVNEAIKFNNSLDLYDQKIPKFFDRNSKHNRRKKC